MTEDDALHRLYQGAIIAEGRGQTKLSTAMLDLTEAIERAAGRTPRKATASAPSQPTAGRASKVEALLAPLVWLRRHIA